MNTIPVQVYEGDKLIGMVGYKITGTNKYKPVWLSLEKIVV